MIFFFLPWLDRGAVKSIRYRGALYKTWLAVFVFCFLVLGYLGVVPVTVWGQFSGGWTEVLGTEDKATWVARVLTVVYFLFFLLMPWYTARDKTKPVPERVPMMRSWTRSLAAATLLVAVRRRARVRRRPAAALRAVGELVRRARHHCSAARATS